MQSFFIKKVLKIMFMGKGNKFNKMNDNLPTNEILQACSTLSYSCEILNDIKSAEIYENIQDLYASSVSELPLWERLNSSSAIYDLNGWRKIDSFVKSKPVLIFFENHQDKNVILLGNDHMLENILVECTGFVFYITNIDFDYLLCYNDHDVLIGSGKAKEWIYTLGNL